MKGSIGIGRSLSVTRRSSFLLQSSFSTSSSGSGSGSGRGRGRGGGASPFASTFDFIPDPGKSDPDVSKPCDSDESPPIGLGHGRGRGRPLSADPVPHSFPSFVSQTGSGRGRVTPETVPPPPQPPGQPRQPIFIKKKDDSETDSFAKPPAAESVRSSEPSLPSDLFSASILSGAGRGKPLKQMEKSEPAPEENRHIRVRQQPPEQQQQPPLKQPPLPQPNLEEAAKRALGMLSRREREESGMASGGGRGGRSEGRGRGRGRGRGMGTGRGRKQREDDRTAEVLDEGSEDELYLESVEDEEKLAEAIGPENMNKLVEGFEELSDSVLPSPEDDAFIDAFHTNCSIEFEPEYLMGDFETNPDIDEKAPIPLRDALEKMKPFLMAYEGIETQEEWEEVMKETMERVPLLQKIVDYYSGPDRVTAKKQQEELERVAKTIPQSAPTSVKRFANRAVLSLQSNPGWGFDKKCQFMDKLVREVSQQYK